METNLHKHTHEGTEGGLSREREGARGRSDADKSDK